MRKSEEKAAKDNDGSSSSSSSSEESKSMAKESKKVAAAAAAPVDDGENSSVNTHQSKTERNHFLLRMAIDDKYVPKSVVNLRIIARFVFAALFLLAILYYFIQMSLFSDINLNIKNI